MSANRKAAGRRLARNNVIQVSEIVAAGCVTSFDARDFLLSRSISITILLLFAGYY